MKIYISILFVLMNFHFCDVHAEEKKQDMVARPAPTSVFMSLDGYRNSKQSVNGPQRFFPLSSRLPIRQNKKNLTLDKKNTAPISQNGTFTKPSIIRPAPTPHNQSPDYGEMTPDQAEQILSIYGH